MDGAEPEGNIADEIEQDGNFDGWDDEEEISVKCFFCDLRFNRLDTALSHCVSVHGIDMLAEKHRLGKKPGRDRFTRFNRPKSVYSTHISAPSLLWTFRFRFLWLDKACQLRPQ